MKITTESLQSAVEHNILSAEQARNLIVFLRRQPSTGPTFDFTHALYYIGGLIAIGAMTLFMNLGWESFGGLGIVIISLIYATMGILLSNKFQAKGYAIPASLCATFVVALTPLGIYGLQQTLGVWPDVTPYQEYHRYIKWHWLYMELGTLAVGVIMAWKYKYPFLIMPIAVTLWYLTMDISAILVGGDVTWDLRQWVSMYSGLLVVGLALWVDVRTRHRADYAFWLYMFGVLAFWCGLSLQYSDSELSKFLYFCINFIMIAVGVLLVRRVFVIFGALGCCGYLGHLAADVFQDSWLFPVALSAIGLLVIYLGILWQKNEAALTQKARSLLPVALRELLESRS
ncbi:MAG: hypothetical protein ACJA13_003595 [Paraglaciecola sp.]|jgi:hypothetical protein